MVTIRTSWHKATASFAMSYKQLEYINSLRTEINCPEWPFSSTTHAMRSLTKEDAANIIDNLKGGETIIFE